MFEHAVRLALEKAELETEMLQCLLGGDLLNQLVTSNYAARQLGVPFLGLYGACSTMAQSMLIGAMMLDGGFAEQVACAASSHFATAERQYRFPLEMGTVAQPTSQRTVTGAGAVVLGAGHLLPPKGYFQVRVTGGTIGRVIDWGITDSANMGAAMAPAAADTIATHLRDTETSTDDFDCIITGDLGKFGSQMLKELCRDAQIDLAGKHLDCGMLVFSEAQRVNCGGSGCGCSAVVLAGHLLPGMLREKQNRLLFVATGALMSPTTSQQGESIPGIAHAVVLERE